MDKYEVLMDCGVLDPQKQYNVVRLVPPHQSFHTKMLKALWFHKNWNLGQEAAPAVVMNLERWMCGLTEPQLRICTGQILRQCTVHYVDIYIQY